MLPEFKRRFWLPPRAHGEVIADRTVSFLELFYDLVYVVVIGRAAHHLAGDVSWRGVGEFAVIFGLVWLAWMNGTLCYELHGREDGRTRVFTFIQMLLLVLLAVYTGDAAGADGQGFAVVYMLFLGVLTWLWYSVRRRDSEEYLVATARYLVGMVLSIATVGLSLSSPMRRGWSSGGSWCSGGSSGCVFSPVCPGCDRGWWSPIRWWSATGSS